jgi:hypothetical protein
MCVGLSCPVPRAVLQLQPGGLYDWSALEVKPDGIIEVLPGSARSFVMIGVAGDVRLRGELRAKLGEQPADTCIAELPGGVTHEEPIVQRAGGHGFTRWCSWGEQPAVFSAERDGNAGEGAGAPDADGRPATSERGGDGPIGRCSYGQDQPTYYCGERAPGGWDFDEHQDGADGFDVTRAVSSDIGDIVGGGGGGGHRGRHGQCVLLVVEGQVTGDGSIDLRGQDGGAGGKGGWVEGVSGGRTSGGGGGGGAGGSGGVLLVYATGELPVTLSLFTAGGQGGDGGAEGDNGRDCRGQPGTRGEDGDRGRYEYLGTWPPAPVE